MTIKKLLLLLLIVPLVFLIQSCGKGAGSGYTPPGSGPGDPVYIKLKPSSHVAQTNGCIDFYAEVHDAQGELLANIPVTFTNLSEPFGVILDRCGGIEIQTPVNTDSWGRARITLMSTTPGFATIIAQTTLGSQPRDRKTVLFSFCDTYECLVLAPSLHLDVDSEPPDGILNETGDFIIFDPLNLLVWGSDHAEATFTRTETWTNVNGQATAQVKFTPLSIRFTETHVNVWAYSDNVSSYVFPFDIVTFFLQPVFIASITVTANPSTIALSGTSEISALVLLNTGDPAPDGTSVIFSSYDATTCTACNNPACTNPCGVIDLFGQTTDGVATATFTGPPTQATCRIIAEANGVCGSTIVIVTGPLTVAPSSDDICESTTLCSAGQNTATFTISGGTGPYTVTSSDNTVIADPGALAGNTFTVDAIDGSITADTSIIMTITDSSATPQTVTATVNVINEFIVMSTTPANGATGVVADTPVVITWDDAVDCLTAIPANVTIAPVPAGGWTAGPCAGSQAQFDPLGQVSNTYTVTVTTSVTDSAGLAMPANYVFSYTVP
jgi:hypothetical protein